MNLNIECEQEEDGRWLADVMGLPGALAYGRTQDEAMVKVEVLTLRILADQLEHGKIRPISINITLQAQHDVIECHVA